MPALRVRALKECCIWKPPPLHLTQMLHSAHPASICTLCQNLQKHTWGWQNAMRIALHLMFICGQQRSIQYEAIWSQNTPSLKTMTPLVQRLVPMKGMCLSGLLLTLSIAENSEADLCDGSFSFGLEFLCYRKKIQHAWDSTVLISWEMWPEVW